jgi:pimeloyl-ACP methyl ester carboxylesterase
MSTRRNWLLAAALAAVAAIAVVVLFRADLRAAHDGLAGRSATIATASGPIEYAVAGTGPPLLMIHGTGGGFDQGLLFSEKLAAQGVRVIAPSRFGYLRSGFPADHSSEAQADAFVALLDHLKLGKVVVAGGSAGALSAVQFALRHPDRTSALILIVPAANVQGHDPNEMSPAQEWMVRRLISSDFLYWTARKLAPKQLIGFLLATDPALLERVPADERERAYRILDQMLPISARWRGMLNDAQLAGHPARMDFRRIHVPMLVISAEDDRFGTAGTSRAIARQVPSSRLLVFPDGGHVLLGHDAESARAIALFVKQHAGGVLGAFHPAGASTLGGAKGMEAQDDADHQQAEDRTVHDGSALPGLLGRQRRRHPGQPGDDCKPPDQRDQHRPVT